VASADRDAVGGATAVLSWSGGKDATVALREMRDSDIQVRELLTTVSTETGRSSMHGVRRELYEQQAAALGLPIRFVEIPEDADNDEYDERMAAATADYERRGVEYVAFADLHLDDVRAYREQRLADADLDGYWPVWGRNTDELVREFLDAGFEATVVAVDGAALPASFTGCRLDADFLADLPDEVDPCGENGEFHTFVHDGPVFEEPVPVETGERVTKEVGHGDATVHYCDLLAAD
jgi:uncharacterized protein (TIGR00290 family)